MMAEGNNRTPRVKKSCKKCRQQKLRCDVVRDPFVACSRCRRLGKECIVDMDGRRVNDYSELRSEIDSLREQLKNTTQQQQTTPDSTGVVATINTPPVDAVHSIATTDGSNSRQLGAVVVEGHVINALYDRYFSLYHPYFPVLDGIPSADHCFSLSQLLGWTIIMVAARRFPQDPDLLESLREAYLKLLWSTIADQKQPYHVIKAYCLLCLWPLPAGQDLFEDPTWQISNIMMGFAVMKLLHFSVQTKPINRDRVLTWVACNIVAQCTSDISGLPVQNFHMSNLGANYDRLKPLNLPKELVYQLKISNFSSRMAQTLFDGPFSTHRLLPADERVESLRQFKELYSSLRATLSDERSTYIQLHLLAAELRLKLFALFLPPSPDREFALSELFEAACTYIEYVIECDVSTGSLLDYSTKLISETMFSALYALLKLLGIHCVFDMQRAKANFNAAVLAIRRVSFHEHDVASRIATRAPMLWQLWLTEYQPNSPMSSLHNILKVQTRMSVSHMYDCIWEWMKHFQSRSDLQIGEVSYSAVADGFAPLLARPDEPTASVDEAGRAPTDEALYWQNLMGLNWSWSPST